MPFREGGGLRLLGRVYQPTGAAVNLRDRCAHHALRGLVLVLLGLPVRSHGTYSGSSDIR